MVENLPSRVNYVESRLASCHTIRAKKSWIEECIKFFISQAPGIDNETLYQQALEQFLLADVVEASNQVIPAPISLKKEPFVLNGTFVVQLLFLIDISESPYEQWRRLYNIRLDEVEEKGPNKQFQPKKKRMFKLELTDGSRTVSAMEYMLIPCLNSKISPGVKLKIIGPLQVVNHILLLEPNNLEILGGDVDSLLIVNAYENVLLRALGKPTTETPVTDYKENEVNQEVKRDHSHIIAKPMNSSTNSSNHQQKVEHELLDGINFEEEDEVDLEMLMQIEQQHSQKPTLNHNQVSNNHASVDAFDDDDEMLAHVDFDFIEENARRSLNVSAEVIEVEDYRPVINRRVINKPMEVIEIVDTRHRDLSVPSITVPNNVQEATDFSFNRCQSTSHDPVPSKVARVQPPKKHLISDDGYEYKTVEGDNILTVDQYNSLSQANKIKKSYVVFGKVDNVFQETLKISKNYWYINANITDDYSKEVLSVKFETSVNEKLSGVSVKEMSLLKKDLQQRPQLKEEITAIIEKLYNEIIRTHCFMKLKMNCPPPRFELLLIELLEENPENHRKFIKKIKDENISKV